MHSLLLVTISMSDGDISEDARSDVYSRLIEDNSFCGECGRFASPLADWFVIGGRWSGFLHEALLGEEYQAAFERESPGSAKGFRRNELADQHRDRLNALWHRLDGKGDHPAVRSDIDDLGAEDDAMPLDKRLYDHFLKDHVGFATNLPGHGSLCDFADLDGEELDKCFIGRKWLVVVDYHS